MAKKKRTQAARQAPPPPKSRWDRYRPTLERALFITALVGLLITAHMNIWWAHYDAAAAGAAGSECGIPGLGGEEGAFNCAAAFESGAGTLFGVSNAMWGLLFYVVVAGISLWIGLGAGTRHALLNKVRAGLIGTGFLYTLFLTGYQFVVLPQRCLLCLLSASVVAVLLVLVWLYFFQPDPAETARRSVGTAEKKLYAALGVVALLVVAGDALYFGGSGSGGIYTESEAPVIATRDIDVEKVCRYDESRPYYANMSALISEDDPMKGVPGAPVTLVEFFDPMCPHCKTAYPILKAVAAKYSDRVQFVYKPVAILGTHSVTQVTALNVAAEEGKFFPMLDLIFDGQNSRGYDLGDLREFAERVGMDDDAFARRMQSGDATNKARRETTIFRDMGLSSVPTVIINGHVIETRSRNVECLSYFLDTELDAAAAGAATEGSEAPAPSDDGSASES